MGEYLNSFSKPNLFENDETYVLRKGVINFELWIDFPTTSHSLLPEKVIYEKSLLHKLHNSQMIC